MRSTNMFRTFKEVRRNVRDGSVNEEKYILIADENPLEARVLAGYLENLGYTVKDVYNGNDALKYIRSSRPMLVISSLEIPGMKGYQLCQTLKGNPETSTIPFMMISTKDVPPDKALGFQQGCDDYITKPLDPSTLKSRVESLLRRSKQYDQIKFSSSIQTIAAAKKAVEERDAPGELPDDVGSASAQIPGVFKTVAEDILEDDADLIQETAPLEEQEDIKDAARFEESDANEEAPILKPDIYKTVDEDFSEDDHSSDDDITLADEFEQMEETAQPEAATGVDDTDEEHEDSTEPDEEVNRVAAFRQELEHTISPPAYSETADSAPPQQEEERTISNYRERLRKAADSFKSSHSGQLSSRLQSLRSEKPRTDSAQTEKRQLDTTSVPRVAKIQDKPVSQPAEELPVKAVEEKPQVQQTVKAEPAVRAPTPVPEAVPPAQPAEAVPEPKVSPAPVQTVSIPEPEPLPQQEIPRPAPEAVPPAQPAAAVPEPKVSPAPVQTVSVPEPEPLPQQEIPKPAPEAVPPAQPAAAVPEPKVSPAPVQTVSVPEPEPLPQQEIPRPAPEAVPEVVEEAERTEPVFKKIAPEEKLKSEKSVKLGLPTRTQIVHADAKTLYKYGHDIIEVLTKAGGKFGADEFLSITTYCDKLAEAATANNVLLSLALSSESEPTLSSHLVNCSIIALRIGKNLQVQAGELSLLGSAGLLFDIGMLAVDPGIRNKRGELTDAEYAKIKKHVNFSVEMIESAIRKDFPQECKYLSKAISQHHERQEGQGYPNKLTGEKISRAGKIIGIADTYEALCHTRYHRSRQTTYRALQEVVGMKKTFFDPIVLRALVNELTFFPIGCYVRLNTEEVGVVIDVSPIHSMRPKINIITDTDGAFLDMPKVVDLVQSPFLYVVKPLEDEDIPEEDNY